MLNGYRMFYIYGTLLHTVHCTVPKGKGGVALVQRVVKLICPFPGVTNTEELLNSPFAISG